MIRSKGIFHTHLVVKDIQRSLRFYCELFGMQDTGFKDSDLVFLTTPGSRDLLALNPEGIGGYPGGCAVEAKREHGLAGVQGRASHFGIMLEGREDYDTAISTAPSGIVNLQRFSFEREDIPVFVVSVGRDKAAGSSRRERPCRKRSAYSGLPSFSLHSSANRCKH